MDQLSAELQSSARGDTQNSHIGKSSSLQDLHRNQLYGIETIADGESRNVEEKFQFKSRFAVSYKPSSNMVKMNTGSEKSHINTDELEQSVLCSSDVYPNHIISGTNDSLSEGLDSISINNPPDIIKEDGTGILWTSVSASACGISDESQIRNWLICKGETEVVFGTWQKIWLHSSVISGANATRFCASIFFVGSGRGARAYSRSISIGRWRHEVLSRLRERNAKQLEPYKKFELAIERVPIKIPNFNPRNCSNSFTVFTITTMQQHCRRSPRMTEDPTLQFYRALGVREEN